MARLHHFSGDPDIDLFAPHVPATNPTHPPAVWAIDADHAPLYWFPRDCPRVTAWPFVASDRAAFEAAFETTAPRLHAMEEAWVERMAATKLYRYDFDAEPFEPWPEASGQWITHETVRPVSCDELGDLFGMHEAARIELRVVASLQSVAELAVDDRWDFSLVRMANAGRGPMI